MELVSDPSRGPAGQDQANRNDQGRDNQGQGPGFRLTFNEPVTEGATEQASEQEVFRFGTGVILWIDPRDYDPYRDDWAYTLTCRGFWP